MKIVNLEKNEQYQLSEGAKLEVNRNNPFFNDYAEQTVPMDIPASDHNCRLLGFPDLFGGRAKMISSDVSIQDGEFHTQCRQAVLSATRKGTIQTSFYLNDGSFYSRVQNVKLKDVFTKPEDTISFNSMTDAINYCRNLRNNQHEKLTIFPVLVTNDSGLDEGYNYKVINAFGKQYKNLVNSSFEDALHLVELFNMNVICFDPDDGSSGCDFINAQTRTEIVNQVPITLDPGYYISPFVRANYVLQRVFEHFGYTLQSNFFSETPPFRNMVLLNNCIDTLVNKKLCYADLLPDVTVPEFLSLFRKKFCCEFSADEGNRTISVVFMKDLLDTPASADLTSRLTAEPTVNYKTEKEYKRIKLTPEKVLDSEEGDSFDDMKDMTASAPAAYFDPETGAFMKDGYSGDFLVPTKIGEASQPYDTGESLEAKEIKVPECIPVFRELKWRYLDDEEMKEVNFGKFLYVGDYKTINSMMVVTGEDNQEATDSTEKQLPMLAFTYMSNGHAEGTVSGYDCRPASVYAYQTHLWNYALYYNGEDGIFERFYRDYDLLLRNSLQTVKAKLLLTQSEKQNLPACARITMRGVSFFLNKLKFTLGGKDEPMESELLTTGLFEPVVEAPTISEMLPIMASSYKWVARSSKEEISKSAYNNSGIEKERTFDTVYPPLPSAELVGQHFGEQSTCIRKKIRHATWLRHSEWDYSRITVWLECVHV